MTSNELLLATKTSAQERGARKLGEHLLYDCQLSFGPLGIMVGDPSNVSAWTPECCGGADGDGISDQSCDDGNRRGCLAGGVGCRTSVGSDDVDVQGNKFGGKPRNAIQVSLGESCFKDDISALDIAKPREFLLVNQVVS